MGNKQTVCKKWNMDNGILYEALQLCEQRNPLVPNLNLDFFDAITNEMVAWLWRYPWLEEIHDILKGMPKGKSSISDGFMVEILQHHWVTIKDDLLAAILHFFCNRQKLSSLNHTFLVLIPKKDNINFVGLYIYIMPWSGIQEYLEAISNQNLTSATKFDWWFANCIHKEEKNHRLYQPHPRIYAWV